MTAPCDHVWHEFYASSHDKLRECYGCELLQIEIEPGVWMDKDRQVNTAPLPSIPSERVEDAARQLVARASEQNGGEPCIGHFHFFMMASGRSLTTDFIPDKLRTKENLTRIRQDVGLWIEAELQRLEKQGG